MRLQQLHQPIAVGEGQRTEQDGVDGREDRAVGTDAERERQHDGGRKARSAAHAAQRETDVAQRRIQDARDIGIAHPLALGDRVAELDPRPTPGILVRDALGAQLVRALTDVKRDLAVDVALQPGGAERVDEASKPGHVGPPRAG